MNGPFAGRRRNRTAPDPRLNGTHPYPPEASITEALAALPFEEPRVPAFTPRPPAPPTAQEPPAREFDVIPVRTVLFDSMARQVLPCAHCEARWSDPDAGAYARLFARLRNTAAAAGWRPDACGCCWSCPECVAADGVWTARFAPVPRGREFRPGQEGYGEAEHALIEVVTAAAHEASVRRVGPWLRRSSGKHSAAFIRPEAA